MSLADRDKPTGAKAARQFYDLGFTIVATQGTATYLVDHGVPVQSVLAKVGVEEALHSPEAVDAVAMLAAGQISLVVNSPRGRGARADGAYIRSAAARNGIPLLTTASAALAAATGIADTQAHEPVVRSLQEYHAGVRKN